VIFGAWTSRSSDASDIRFVTPTTSVGHQVGEAVL